MDFPRNTSGEIDGLPWQYLQQHMSHKWMHNPNLKCNSFRKHNTTVVIYGGYEGIPQNILLNVICWLMLLLLFSFLRKTAWNYGRLALVQKAERRWTQLFYGHTGELIQSSSDDSSVTSLDPRATLDKGFFSWILAVFRVTDDHILSHSGRDAVEYLSFQRHILVYVTIVTVISLSVVLPINFQGELEGDSKTFGHTTISNLDPTSLLLWVHVSLPILFLALGIIIMRRFSVRLKLETEDESVSRTLMITRMPKDMCVRYQVVRHFEEAYTDMEIQDIQFAYDIQQLMKLDRQRENVTQAKLFCEAFQKTTTGQLEMRPYACGLVCGCCDIFGCPKVDALAFYTEEEERLIDSVETERVMSLRRPLGIAFITFGMQEMATQVLRDHRATCKCNSNPPSSSVSRDLLPYKWHVTFAPPPQDIYWANLSVGTEHWYIKAFFLNLCLFLVLFFLTTPAIIINSLDLLQLRNELEKMSPMISESVSTLLLWTVAALLPVIVSYSDQWMSHWTRSAENYSIMRKTFIFLLFMVLILPSLGLTSAKAFVEWAVHSRNETYRWECVFLPDNGAFFVNYVITSAFIGTSLELIRFPELIVYAFRLCLARSNAEMEGVRKSILWEFPFGVQYAWMMLIFAMTIVYSISCPLITPFGLLYMLFKHFVDRHNIIFAYGPSRIGKEIHVTAVNFVIMSIILLQMILLFFSFLRRGLANLTIFSLTTLVITLSCFLAQVFLHWFGGISAISYRRSTTNTLSQSSSASEAVIATEGSMYLPNVLQNTPEENVPSDSSARLEGYGTNAVMEAVNPAEQKLYQDYYDDRHADCV